MPIQSITFKFYISHAYGKEKVNFLNFFSIHSSREVKCTDTVVSLYDLVGGNLEVKLTGNKSYVGLPSRSLGKKLKPKFQKGC